MQKPFLCIFIYWLDLYSAFPWNAQGIYLDYHCTKQLQYNNSLQNHSKRKSHQMKNNC